MKGKRPSCFCWDCWHALRSAEPPTPSARQRFRRVYQLPPGDSGRPHAAVHPESPAWYLLLLAVLGIHSRYQSLRDLERFGIRNQSLLNELLEIKLSHPP